MTNDAYNLRKQLFYWAASVVIVAAMVIIISFLTLEPGIAELFSFVSILCVVGTFVIFSAAKLLIRAVTAGFDVKKAVMGYKLLLASTWVIMIIGLIEGPPEPSSGLGAFFIFFIYAALVLPLAIIYIICLIPISRSGSKTAQIISLIAASTTHLFTLLILYSIIENLFH